MRQRPFLDLESARRHVRAATAAREDDELLAALAQQAEDLADELERRPGRDLEAAGDLVLEAASFIASLHTAVPELGPNDLINVLGLAGLRLTERSQASAPRAVAAGGPQA
jgi:hypothetical protein